MKISSPIFQDQTLIPGKYTCDGENINPTLRINDVPTGAVSLVLIMDDPDVPEYVRKDGVWDHWVVFNIPPETSEIPEGSEPQGVAGQGTAGNTKYHGPCPPDGKHRYFFKLYALDTRLELRAGASKREVLEAMRGHVLSEATLIGYYDRS